MGFQDCILLYFYDYLYSFYKLVHSCKDVLLQMVCTFYLLFSVFFLFNKMSTSW